MYSAQIRVLCFSSTPPCYPPPPSLNLTNLTAVDAPYISSYCPCDGPVNCTISTITLTTATISSVDLFSPVNTGTTMTGAYSHTVMVVHRTGRMLKQAHNVTSISNNETRPTGFNWSSVRHVMVTYRSQIWNAGQRVWCGTMMRDWYRSDITNNIKKIT